MDTGMVKFRLAAPVLRGLVALGLIVATASSWSATEPHWVDSWAAAPDQAGPSLKAVTLRQIMRTSVGGSRVRIRLSNLFGTAPITIGPVHIARHASGSAIDADSDLPITFNGKATVTIAKGQSEVSDPVQMEVTALQELAVSLYLPKHSGASTAHGVGMAHAYIARGIDATAAVNFPAGKVVGSRFFLTDIEVESNASPGAIVTMGDSITDGVGSTPDANSRWPDILAARLQLHRATGAIGVVDVGIAGNRILHDGDGLFVGPSALSRLDRDVLDKPGVHWLILLEGIVDIGSASMIGTPKADVSAQQIIDGMKTLIARAHEKGIKVIGGTLTPFAGTEPFDGVKPFYTAAGNAKRQAVNSWIRESGAFDAVADFDQATRDPEHPDHLLPAFDSGDHLHPSDAGYKAMATAIDLHFFVVGE